MKNVTNWWQDRKIDCFAMKIIVLRYKISCHFLSLEKNLNRRKKGPIYYINHIYSSYLNVIKYLLFNLTVCIHCIHPILVCIEAFLVSNGTQKRHGRVVNYDSALLMRMHTIFRKFHHYAENSPIFVRQTGWSSQ